MEQYGILVAPDTLRFERTLPGPIERVWAYLTDSDKRGLWLAKGEMELVEGGKVHLEFIHQELSPVIAPTPEKFRDIDCTLNGKVLRIDAPFLLAFTWGGGSEVSFELEPEKDNLVRLTVTHRKLTPDQYSVGPGWHTHLDILDTRLHEKTADNFWKSFLHWEAAYEKRLKPTAGK